MRTFFFSFFAVLINLSCISQEHKLIHVSKDIELTRLTRNAFVHVSYVNDLKYGRFSSNGFLYISNGKAFLFDTPVNDSLTKELLTWIYDSLKVEIVGFVPNHWHSDCMGGLSYIKEQGINSFGNQMTIDIARSKGLPFPSNGFNDSLTLTLGDKEVCCYYLGAAHSTDNIVVWIPSEKILFPGCMCKDLNTNGLGNVIDGNLADYPKTIEKIIVKFDSAKVVVPGHGQIGGVELLKHTMELLLKEY